MAAFALSFRDTLEAALIIGLALVVLIRLGRGQLAQALWTGAGAGALLGFSIATGLIAGGLVAAGSAWTVVEITLMALSLVALGGLLLTGRRFSAESGPALWLAVAVGAFAALPQTLDLVTRLANDVSGAASLVLSGLGIAAAMGLAAAVSLSLLRMKQPQAPADDGQTVAGELAPVPQRVE